MLIFIHYNYYALHSVNNQLSACTNIGTTLSIIGTFVIKQKLEVYYLTEASPYSARLIDTLNPRAFDGH